MSRTPTKIYVGDIGTAIILDVGQSILGATTANIKVTLPDKTIVTWVGAVYTKDGSPNYIKFSSISGTFTQSGTYKMQAYVVLPTWSGSGNTVTFIVFKAYS